MPTQHTNTINRYTSGTTHAYPFLRCLLVLRQEPPPWPNEAFPRCLPAPPRTASPDLYDFSIAQPFRGFKPRSDNPNNTRSHGPPWECLFRPSPVEPSRNRTGHPGSVCRRTVRSRAAHGLLFPLRSCARGHLDRRCSSRGKRSVINTGVPTATRSKSTITSSFNSRIQPWDDGVPMRDSSLVP